MKIIDISWPISSTVTAYKDRKVVAFELVKEINKDGARESTITIGAHSGTHIDAPSHFVRDGKTIDQLDLSSVIGPCKVFDMSTISDGITRAHLENLDINTGDMVLFKTKNSELESTASFSPSFIYLEISGAEYLVERKIRAVGIDYLGIERGQTGHLTHNALFKADITIIEGLRLKEVKQGNYFLCCLPIKTIGIEAAPARAILIEGI